MGKKCKYCYRPIQKGTMCSNCSVKARLIRQIREMVINKQLELLKND